MWTNTNLLLAHVFSQDDESAPVLKERKGCSPKVLLESKRWVILMHTFLPEVAAAALTWNMKVCVNFHKLSTGRSGDPPGLKTKFQFASGVHNRLKVVGAGIRDTKAALEILFDGPGRVADVAQHYLQHAPKKNKVWVQALDDFKLEVMALKSRLLGIAEDAQAMGLTTREVPATSREGH